VGGLVGVWFVGSAYGKIVSLRSLYYGRLAAPGSHFVRSN